MSCLTCFKHKLERKHIIDQDSSVKTQLDCKTTFLTPDEQENGKEKKIGKFAKTHGKNEHKLT